MLTRQSWHQLLSIGLLTLVFGGCGGDASGAGETECLEDTGGAMSGDEGCMFVPGCVEEGEDEGPTVKLDLSPAAPLCELDCPPPPHSKLPEDPEPPPDWEHDPATDTFYRLASETERAVHAWPEGTALLSAGALVDGLVNGRDAPMTLALPMVVERDKHRALELEHVKLIRRRSQSPVTYLSAHAHAGELVNHAFKPQFHLFLPTWLELDALARGVPPGVDSFALAYGDSHGGVVVQAMTSTEDLLISGPSSKLWLERPPPDAGGVLVSKPSPREAALDELLAHWVALGAEYCADTTCAWELEPEQEEPANCRDCVDNDGDGTQDSGDLTCRHREDFGCAGFGPHEHRREDVKDFAELPDIEWCTRMEEAGMPWHTELYAQASGAAALINALPAAASLHPDYWSPASVPRIRYRFAYCVFAESIEAAEDCVATGNNCPAGYSMGGVGTLIAARTLASRTYFVRMWTEYDTAMHALEEEGLTPRPVAMLSGLYSGNLVMPNLIPDLLIGLASTIGTVDLALVGGGLGASTLEAEYLDFKVIAHELGHLLGLSHTNPDPHLV